MPEMTKSEYERTHKSEYRLMRERLAAEREREMRLRKVAREAAEKARKEAILRAAAAGTLVAAPKPVMRDTGEVFDSCKNPKGAKLPRGMRSPHVRSASFGGAKGGFMNASFREDGLAEKGADGKSRVRMEPLRRKAKREVVNTGSYTRIPAATHRDGVLGGPKAPAR